MGLPKQGPHSPEAACQCQHPLLWDEGGGTDVRQALADADLPGPLPHVGLQAGDDARENRGPPADCQRRGEVWGPALGPRPHTPAHAGVLSSAPGPFPCPRARRPWPGHLTWLDEILGFLLICAWREKGGSAEGTQDAFLFPRAPDAPARTLLTPRVHLRFPTEEAGGRRSPQGPCFCSQSLLPLSGLRSQGEVSWGAA